MGLNWASAQSSALAACLDSVSALGLKAGVRAPAGEVTWLRHAGLLGGAPRSMTGLLAMLSDRFGVAATGTQFCGAWRNLERRDIARLSTRAGHKGPRLGRSAVLGKRVWDQSASIRVALSGLSLQRVGRLLRGGDEYQLLKWMIRRYLQQDVGVELVLHLDGRESVPSVLSQKQPLRLGWTSWIVGSRRPNAGLPPARFKLIEDDSVAQAA
jgi:type VI secretion system protein ImpH